MSSIQNHTDLLNYLATTFNLRVYLEIGVKDPRNNYDQIKCEVKYGIEPVIPTRLLRRIILRETSDEWFRSYKNKVQGTDFEGFDLIFIDGLHHADQVKRDFENSLRCLTDRGFIVIHDTLPTHEKYTHVPRDSRIWFGNVYKFAMQLYKYDGIEYWTLDVDCGCTVIWRAEYNKAANIHIHPDWQLYTSQKTHFLHIVKEEMFLNLLKTRMNDAVHGHTV